MRPKTTVKFPFLLAYTSRHTRVFWDTWTRRTRWTIPPTQWVFLVKTWFFLEICLRFFKNAQFFPIGLLFIAIYHFLAKKISPASSPSTSWMLFLTTFIQFFAYFPQYFFLNPSGRLSFLGLTFLANFFSNVQMSKQKFAPELEVKKQKPCFGGRWPPWLS